MKKQSFSKFWIIITVTILLAGLILLAWTLSLRATENDVLENYNQQQLLLVEGTAVGIEGLFEDISVGLGALADVAALQYFDEEIARDELAQKLDELSALGITDIAFLDADGIAKIFAVDTGAEGIDYSWRSYFKDAQASQVGDDTIIVELQTIQAGELGFKIAIPIFETLVDGAHPDPSGDFVGVLVGNLTFDTLIERHIAPFKPQGSGHIFLVNADYDVIWSSDDGLRRANLLGSGQRRFNGIVDAMEGWQQGDARGKFYIDEGDRGWNSQGLVAFAPVQIGKEIMAVGVYTPEEVVRQTSFTNFRSQQIFFAASILTILIGALIAGIVMRRETQRRFAAEEALSQREKEQAIVAERNRLASELHDSVTQGLYGMLLHAEASKGLMNAGKTERAIEYLDEIRTAGKEALAEMRLLIFELRPPVLEQEGLAAALEMRLYAVEKRAGLKVDVQTALDGRLPLDVEDGLYRVAQEVLNNALKHAQAEHVSLKLSEEGGLVRLEINDDGRGFDLDEARKSGGMGLSMLEERVEKMNGSLQMESQLGQGTRTLVEVKL